MRVLVTGARGFIGSHIVAALSAAGFSPVAAVRHRRGGPAAAGVERIGCDFAADTDPAVWLPRLRGIDAVVNCAGILRERSGESFACVHERAPDALFRACHEAGVRRVVQISALGDPADGEFIASKHRCDAALMASDLDWVVLRPSLVYSSQGSYGGTSLLRALAALPLIALPGGGEQPVQPIDAADVGRAVVAALTRDAAVGRCLELGGPAPMSLRTYLEQWRRWLGLGRAWVVAAPPWLAAGVATLGERFGNGPLGLTMWRMLRRGNVAAPAAAARCERALGFAPAALAQVLIRRPAYSADRWHARLYLLAPALRMTLALTWIASGAVGLLLPPDSWLPLFGATQMGPSTLLALGWGGSGVDLLLGLGLLAGWRPRAVLAAMALSVLAYTGFLGTVLPAAWSDPFGGLMKNAVILAALAVAAATAERN